MALSPNHRNTIDQDVYKWVALQQKKDKVVTPNAIRQKAYEIGQDFDPNFKASLNWYNNWKKRYEYNESPEAVALKHKKRSYTAAFKLHAVQRVLELESASQASLELDVSRRCLQRWKEELDLISSVAEHSSNAVYRRPGQGRKVLDSSLDAQVLEWVQECWKQGVNVSSGMIREKARELSNKDNFKASLGWFVKWQKRHSVDLKEQTCTSPAPDSSSPLRLRLLPEGEVSTYSTPSKRRKTKKRKLSYDDEALLENDEEFDRLLLTWLVERWEAGDIVNDRMLKDRALELTANPEFKASKAWLLAWKRKYNVSLENQTYGNEEGEEGEEIVDESVVYDNEVVLEDPQAQQAGTSTKGPLTPTKEEAATALASLSEDHEATGLEIAEALQKLANAIGAVQGGDEQAKEAMAQLAAAYNSDNPEFILEGAGNVAMEEVISEEVVTDEPMVVIEAGEETSSLAPIAMTTQQLVEQVIAGVDSQSQTKATVSPSISEAVQIVMSQATGAMADHSPPMGMTSSLTPSTTVMTTSPSSSYVTEEVVIGEPIIEPVEGQVEVVVHGSDGGIVLLPTSGPVQDIVQMVATSHVDSSVLQPDPSSALVQHLGISVSSSMEEVHTTPVESIVTTSPRAGFVTVVSTQEVVTTTPEVVLTLGVLSDAVVQLTEQSSGAGHTPEIPIPDASQEILDIVQDSISTPSLDDNTQGSPTRRMYDEDFKTKVVLRAKELGSIQQAAREFSVPWRAVATWDTQESASRQQE